MSELREYIRILRKLRLELYPESYSDEKIANLMKDVDKVFENQLPDDVREVWEKDFKYLLPLKNIDDLSQSRADMREGRALLTEIILSILDLLESQRS
ncbi:MAG: hypothetical protein AAF149_15730 [Bacteroidota bacterium]